MSKTITNITLPVVIEEIGKVLEPLPHYPAQQAFAIPELRQKLTAYVLSRISNCYAVVEDEEPITSKFVWCSSQQRLQIETLVAQGVQDILEQNLNWVFHHIPEKIDPDNAPSNWFG